jgi:hypothetical protein
MNPEFGDPTEPHTLSSTQVIEFLRQQCCDPGEPWVGDEHDHGHTGCYFFNTAADIIVAERALADDLASELADAAHSLENFQDLSDDLRRVLARYREARGR